MVEIANSQGIRVTIEELAYLDIKKTSSVLLPPGPPQMPGLVCFVRLSLVGGARWRRPGQTPFYRYVSPKTASPTAIETNVTGAPTLR